VIYRGPNHDYHWVENEGEGRRYKVAKHNHGPRREVYPTPEWVYQLKFIMSIPVIGLVINVSVQRTGIRSRKEH